MSTVGKVQSNPHINSNETKEIKRNEANSKTTESSLSNNDSIKFKTYQVKKGDNLWNISKKELGVAKNWPEIYKLNKDQIKNPNLIYPKQVLKLPIQLFEEKVEVETPVKVEKPITPEIKPEKEIVPEVKPEEIKPEIAPVIPEVKEEQKTFITDKPETVTAKISPKDYSVLKAAAIGGAIGTVGTGATLIGVTRALKHPVANFGGYATAQKVSKGIRNIGVPFPSGPSLSKVVSKVGGPKSAGALTAVAVGVVVAGVAAGGYYLYKKSKED